MNNEMFVPSKRLALKILREQTRVCQRSLRESLALIKNLDALLNDTLEISDCVFSDTQTAIANRFDCYVCILAGRITTCKQTYKTIATRSCLVLGDEFKGRLGFPIADSPRLRWREFWCGKVSYHWFDDLLKELRAWLCSKPEQKQVWSWGVMELKEDGSIFLYPVKQEETIAL